MSQWQGALAGFRFHAAAGGRVALRNTWMGIMVVLFAVIVLSPDPVGLTYAFARSLTVGGESPWAMFVMAAFAASLSRAARPQLSAGGSGWMRSLPLDTAGRRYALVFALVLAQAPVLVVALASVIAAVVAPQMELSVLKVLAMPAIALGAALLAVPARAPRPRWRGRGWLPYRVAWRALSWRIVPCLLPTVIPLAGAWFFRHNNPLTAAEATNTVRVCGIVAMTLALAGLADELHRRRPVWAWARSLPWSTAQRIGHDTTTLVAGAFPVLCVIAALDVVALATVIAVTPLLGLVAAGAIRRAGTRRTAAAGEVLLVGVIMTIAIALSAWSLAVFVAATPLALRIAARRERRLSPSQWLELHHRVEGDSAFLGAA